MLDQARDELVSSVLGGGPVDLRITALRPTERTVRRQRLLSEPLCVAVPAGHRLAGRRRISPAEVSEGPTIYRPSGGWWPRAWAWRSCPPPAHRAPDAGPAAVHHVPIADRTAKRDVGLAWSTERRLLPAAEEFRQFVLHRAAAGDVPAAVAP